ncbi:very-long-chain (3R)-3-hydroxyacyl-CoA dehydratase-like [Styela clava]|uniref:very-long-chain (3R)-3-hydroxyacyl-CoA dehydratase-like n=1 Tax=Styela clava TaxID=7725 RepID=UPI00193AA1A1|nr:very-long-chain (3R)-3-hydroxyacyl-CoA dehydratase-like [Styela clava]
MGDGEYATLLPTVRWAQRKDMLSLKIELQQCHHPNIVLKTKSMTFEAKGVGANGENQYKFSLEFYKPIDEESCIHKVTGSSVEVFLTKEGMGEWWPQLTSQKKSPHFLKLDFDKWRSESDEEDEKRKEQESSFLRELKNEKKKYEETVDMLRRGYLVLYNVIQFLAHCYIFFFLTVNIFRGGTKLFPIAYDRCGNAVHFAVVLSFMEAVHPFTGIMKGSWITPLMQVFGRNFALFCLWLAADFIKHEWYVTVLLLAWSSIEMVRYPFYVCETANIPSRIVTWLRYSLWIPLYPLGVSMETVLYIRVSQVFAERGMYELNMPNAFNFTFKFIWLIRLYVALLLYTIVTVMIPHMWKMRQRKLNGRRKYKQP